MAMYQRINLNDCKRHIESYILIVFAEISTCTLLRVCSKYFKHIASAVNKFFSDFAVTK